MSRTSSPKQLLPILSDRTMIEETILRGVAACGKAATPLIITSAAIAKKTKDIASKAAPVEVVAEVAAKNTAPAIALAAALAIYKHGDAVLAVLSADHAISPLAAFVKTIRRAAEVAQDHNRIVVFGIKPSRPETGYGYIHRGKSLDSKTKDAFFVEKFVEKPDAATAKKLVQSDAFFWNSGIFVFKASVMLDEFKLYMPGVYDKVMLAAKKNFTKTAINAFYTSVESQSIDYGILEQSKRIAMVAAGFSWDDVGSWEAISRHHPLNSKKTVAVGKQVYECDCADSIIVNHSTHVVAAVGLKDVVLVCTDGVVLAMNRQMLPDIKKYLNEVRKRPGVSPDLF